MVSLIKLYAKCKLLMQMQYTRTTHKQTTKHTIKAIIRIPVIETKLSFKWGLAYHHNGRQCSRNGIANWKVNGHFPSHCSNKAGDLLASNLRR